MKLLDIIEKKVPSYDAARCLLARPNWRHVNRMVVISAVGRIGKSTVDCQFSNRQAFGEGRVGFVDPLQLGAVRIVQVPA